MLASHPPNGGRYHATTRIPRACAATRNLATLRGRYTSLLTGDAELAVCRNSVWTPAACMRRTWATGWSHTAFPEKIDTHVPDPANGRPAPAAAGDAGTAAVTSTAARPATTSVRAARPLIVPTR